MTMESVVYCYFLVKFRNMEVFEDLFNLSLPLFSVDHVYCLHVQYIMFLIMPYRYHPSRGLGLATRDYQ